MITLAFLQKSELHDEYMRRLWSLGIRYFTQTSFSYLIWIAVSWYNKEVLKAYTAVYAFEYILYLSSHFVTSGIRHDDKTESATAVYVSIIYQFIMGALLLVLSEEVIAFLNLKGTLARTYPYIIVLYTSMFAYIATNQYFAISEDYKKAQQSELRFYAGNFIVAAITMLLTKRYEAAFIAMSVFSYTNLVYHIWAHIPRAFGVYNVLGWVQNKCINITTGIAWFILSFLNTAQASKAVADFTALNIINYCYNIMFDMLSNRDDAAQYYTASGNRDFKGLARANLSFAWKVMVLSGTVAVCWSLYATEVNRSLVLFMVFAYSMGAIGQSIYVAPRTYLNVIEKHKGVFLVTLALIPARILIGLIPSVYTLGISQLMSLIVISVSTYLMFIKSKTIQQE